MIRLEDSGPGVGTRPGASPAQRLRQVRRVGGLLPELGVRIAPTGNGHVAITLPAELAEIFLEDLQQRAQEWAHAMRKARLEEAERQARLVAESRARSGEMEQQEDAWLERYEQARGQGRGHRQAVHQVAGYDPKTPRGLQQNLPVFLVAEGIARARARAKAQARVRRTAEIITLTRQGLSRWAIGDRLGISYAIVCLTLNRAGIEVPDRRRRTT